MKKAHIQFPDELLSEAETAAKLEDRTLASFVRMAVRHYIKFTNKESNYYEHSRNTSGDFGVDRVNPRSGHDFSYGALDGRGAVVSPDAVFTPIERY